MENDGVGKRIKERRMEIGLSAAQLAESLKLSKATVYRYESGEIKDIKMPVIEAMSKALHVNPLWLTGASKTKDTDTYRDFSVGINDIKIFIETVSSLKYHDHQMDEHDMMFLKAWVRMLEDYFESRYK